MFAKHCGVSDRCCDNREDFVKSPLCEVRPQLGVEKLPTSATPDISVYGTCSAILASCFEVRSIERELLAERNIFQIDSSPTPSSSVRSAKAVLPHTTCSWCRNASGVAVLFDAHILVSIEALLKELDCMSFKHDVHSICATSLWTSS
jgi:hypothetical protein